MAGRHAARTTHGAKRPRPFDPGQTRSARDPGASGGERSWHRASDEPFQTASASRRPAARGRVEKSKTAGRRSPARRKRLELTQSDRHPSVNLHLEGIIGLSGRSAAWLAHQTGGLGAAGSNPAVPTNFLPDVLRVSQPCEIVRDAIWPRCPRCLGPLTGTSSMPAWTRFDASPTRSRRSASAAIAGVLMCFVIEERPAAALGCWRQRRSAPFSPMRCAARSAASPG